MELGRYLGNFLGGPLPRLKDSDPAAGGVAELRRVGLTNQMQVCWPASAPQSIEHVFIDRDRATTVAFAKTTALVQLPDGDRHYYDVITSGPRVHEPVSLLRKYLRNYSARRVELTWTPAASAAADGVLYYSVELDDVEVAQLPINITRWVSGDLEPGAHTFDVAAVDAAGNRSTEVSAGVTVPDYVLPASGPVIAVLDDPVAPTVALDWTASLTAGVTEYRVYGNDGTGFSCESLIDFETPAAVVAAPLTLATVPVGAGDWKFVIRAATATAEDDSFDVRAELRIVDTGSLYAIAGGIANPVATWDVAPVAGGAFLLTAVYNALGETAKAVAINVYVTTAAEFDFDADLYDTVTLADHELGEGSQEVTLSMGPFADGTYKVLLRVVDVLGLEEKSTRFITVVNDSTSPSPVTSLAVTLI